MGHDRPPRFQVRHEQGCTIINASGPEIEFGSKDDLYALASSAALEPKRVVLNLEQVKNFQSAILGVLIQFRRQVEKAGGTLKVVCSDPTIRLMFQITKVDLVLDLYESERTAIEAFHPLRS